MLQRKQPTASCLVALGDEDGDGLAQSKMTAPYATPMLRLDSKQLCDYPKLHRCLRGAAAEPHRAHTHPTPERVCGQRTSKETAPRLPQVKCMHVSPSLSTSGVDRRDSMPCAISPLPPRGAPARESLRCTGEARAASAALHVH